MVLLTVGHGTLDAAALAALLTSAGVQQVVDVRTAPGSRRFPHFSRDAMSAWLGEAGLGYRWEPELGGWRRPGADSPNRSLRHTGFRGYADHMLTGPFWAALDRLLEDAAAAPTAALCAESLWWRCHRRLLADAAVLVRGVEVAHLLHDGRVEPHRVTEGVRRAGSGLVYDGGEPTLPDPGQG